MTDNNDYLKTSTGNFRLRADVMTLMLKGAGYAALFCFALLIGWWVLVGISALLPDESKEALDPMPRSSLMMPAADIRVA